MQKWKMIFPVAVVVAMILSACSTATPGEAPVTMPTAVQEPMGAVDSSTQPQRIDFQSTDGTQLVGTFWPPVQSPAPGVILMHMMGSRKESWQSLPSNLQNPGTAQKGYAVFAFDFRGHGESKGNSGDHPGLLEDAKAALSTFRSLPGVDPGRIVLIGASIGADAAVDACLEGCMGAVSLSPGSYLDIPYANALTAMGGKPVLCVASESDGQPAQTCRNGEQLGLADYQIQIYTGGSHGTEMLSITDQQPLVADLIMEWLAGHAPQG